MFFIIIGFMLLLAIFTYLILLGASKCKTEEEKKFEDEEQIKYLQNYKNGGK